VIEPTLIYVHGFNSSPASVKAGLLRDALAASGDLARFRAPALAHWPAEAIVQLEREILAAPGPVTLIGSSLGGYYSTWLVEQSQRPGQALSGTDLRAVLVNPAVTPYRLLAQWLGENENLYTADHYQLTETHLQQLLALDCARLHDPQRYLLLLQTADETLDYREAVDKYAACVQFVEPGGCHGFDRFERLIPAIRAFASGRIELPPPAPVSG